jgi:hypothetical protein
MYNQIIKLDHNLTELQALKMARDESYIATGQIPNKSYIYIIQPDVSDLVIAKNNIFRKCTDAEWAYYFHNLLYPPKEIK